MLAKNLMMAPVLTKEDTCQVIFPKGKLEYNRKTIKGPVKKMFNVSLDKLLIFERINSNE